MLAERDLSAIIERYSGADDIVQNSYSDGGCSPLWPRLERAIINQLSCSLTAIPRYAIWANTVRDNIEEALHELDSGQMEDARKRLIESANSLSAFSEVQSFFDVRT